MGINARCHGNDDPNEDYDMIMAMMMSERLRRTINTIVTTMGISDKSRKRIKTGEQNEGDNGREGDGSSREERRK